MTSARKRRAARHKLKAHDRGDDRHNKGLSDIKKQQRLRQERNQARHARAATRSGDTVIEHLTDGVIHRYDAHRAY